MRFFVGGFMEKERFGGLDWKLWEINVCGMHGGGFIVK